MKKQNFVITGMTCSACSSRVEKCVSAIDGTSDVSVNLLTNSMRLSYDENLTSEDDIIQTVIRAGYGAAVKGSEAAGSAAASSAGVLVCARQPLQGCTAQRRTVQDSSSPLESRMAKRVKS